MLISRHVCFVASFVAVVSWVSLATAQKPPLPTFPKGLAALKYPEDNPHLEEKVELGKQLYFDKRLSKDDTISCALCHDPEKGWSNGEAFATGVRGQVGGRSSPSIVNSAYSELQFWDGRANMLEGQRGADSESDRDGYEAGGRRRQAQQN